MNKNLNKKQRSIIILFILIIIIILGLLFFGVDKISEKEISNFEECVGAGNPVMESYPRQCHDSISGKTFIEEIKE